MGISQYRLAKEIDVPAQRISEIVSGRRAITADTDLRLCRLFGLSSDYWLRAQVAHDTEVAERKLRPVLHKIKPWVPDAVQQGAVPDAGASIRESHRPMGSGQDSQHLHSTLPVPYRASSASVSKHPALPLCNCRQPVATPTS